jgi:hypothetical protein
MKNPLFSDSSLRDYFASQAMLATIAETQEMRIGSFWEWIKLLLVTYLHFSFLHVKYIKVDNAYQDAAKRCYEYADAMLLERSKVEQINLEPEFN